MGIVVQKYGGSSVSTIEKIQGIAERLIQRKENGDSMVVVVSAMGDTTDDLINLAHEISSSPDKRELDALLSTGEIISSSLLAMAIKEKGYESVSYTGYQLKIQTTDSHGKALIKDLDENRLKESLKEGKIVIVAGFQGIDSEGDITTLGRGGSDTTAVALACKIGASCEIYTDVDGIYSADPRKLKGALKLDSIHYEEMLELASLGAQVMHSRSIELASKYDIPIYVGLSTGDIRGTLIMNNMYMESKPITGIATSNEDIAITLKDINSNVNIISNLFNSIAEEKINIDMISQTSPIDDKVNISFTIPKDELEECMEIIKVYVNDTQITFDEDITKFSVVGIGMKTTSGVAARIFKLFSDNDIEVKMVTTSEIRITCAIKRSDELKAIKLVAKEFDISK